MSENKKRNIVLITIAISIGILSGFGFYNANKDNSTEEIVSSAVNEIKDYITTYNMSQEEIEELPSTEITEQTESEEQEVSAEQEGESEDFELQGEIAYNGTTEYPNISLGVCGEHGGDPSSIEFCHLVGLDYVSCSPFRVPIARLAAAQAAIREKVRK